MFSGNPITSTSISLIFSDKSEIKGKTVYCVTRKRFLPENEIHITVR